MMNTDSLARAVGELLQQRRLTLAVAESCTGGLLATHITNIPGSSAYFGGGVVAYSDDVKERMLNVPADVLEQHGAVSPETAITMAKGVRQLLQVDLALAVTGIAGPTGGTAEKPVGLAYIALASDQGEECRRCLWAGDRWENRESSARAALELLHDHLTARSPRQDPGEDVPPSVERNKDARGMQVEVDARFDEHGHLIPLAFKWQGQWMQVASRGRTWSTGQGEKLIHHYMVSTPGEAVFELTFEPATMYWHVVRGGTKHMVA
jgi:nicotinamide-nucleotide amidase